MIDDEAGTTSPSMRVVDAIATAIGVDPIDLDPLSNCLALEALDDLLANSSVPVRVECTIDEVVVAVDPDGEVRVSSASTD
jgi:predicted dinucleotide-binding enzyme